MNKTKAFIFKFNEKDYEYLKKRAYRENKSMAAVVRELIKSDKEKYLKTGEK
jgi:hypothetical protein